MEAEGVPATAVADAPKVRLLLPILSNPLVNVAVPLTTKSEPSVTAPEFTRLIVRLFNTLLVGTNLIVPIFPPPLIISDELPPPLNKPFPEIELVKVEEPNVSVYSFRSMISVALVSVMKLPFAGLGMVRLAPSTIEPPDFAETI